jgi:hypothetical protein
MWCALSIHIKGMSKRFVVRVIYRKITVIAFQSFSERTKTAPWFVWKLPKNGAHKK